MFGQGNNINETNLIELIEAPIIIEFCHSISLGSKKIILEVGSASKFNMAGEIYLARALARTTGSAKTLSLQC